MRLSRIEIRIEFLTEFNSRLTCPCSSTINECMPPQTRVSIPAPSPPRVPSSIAFSILIASQARHAGKRTSSFDENLNRLSDKHSPALQFRLVLFTSFIVSHPKLSRVASSKYHGSPSRPGMVYNPSSIISASVISQLFSHKLKVTAYQGAWVKPAFPI